MNALHPGMGYIYALTDPVSGETFYVGETVKGIHSRLFHHMSKSLDPTWVWYDNPLPKKIREVYANGSTPDVSLLETVESVGDAVLDKRNRIAAEKFWIKKLKTDGEPLLNADRSDVMRKVHANRTAEQRQKISQKGAPKRRKNVS